MNYRKIIKFLKNPKNYPQPVKKVKHLETYISDVFLTGKFAYKIKKPVNYGYLDFTTLAKRKFFCQQELKLNRRLSPEMYLSVLPLLEKKGHLLKVEPSNSAKNQRKMGVKIVDYVLKMKEIPQQYLMYKQLKKNKVNKKIIEKMARIIANFHKKAATSAKISFFGSLKIIKKNWQENFSQTKSFIGQTISLKNYQFIKKSVENFIQENKKIFQQRIKDKKIRDGYGDFHTGNIFITPNKIYIFDCIEFNERFRYQDTVNEVAFLAMDLDFLGRKDLSDYFIQKYIDYSGDENIKKLLLFYKCYRAYVKGKVCGFHFANRSLSKNKRMMYKKIAQKAFKLAVEYIQERQKPIIILGAGLPGIGRSTRLKFLAQKIKAKILDSDVIRRQILKKVNYRADTKFKVYQEMIKRAGEFLKSGKNVILDATFSKEKYRQLAKNLAKKLKMPYFLIEFFASGKVARQRFQERAKEERPVSEANWQVYQKIKKEFEPIKKEENYFRISTVKLPVKNIREILEKIVQ